MLLGVTSHHGVTMCHNSITETTHIAGATSHSAGGHFHHGQKIKIVYSVWQQCMLDSRNYNKVQMQITQHQINDFDIDFSCWLQRPPRLVGRPPTMV